MRSVLLPAASLLIGIGLLSFGSSLAAADPAPAAPAAPAATSAHVEHLVLLRWKDGVTPEQEADMSAKLLALRDQVPGILTITFGHQSSPQAAQKGHGFSVGLHVLFVDAAARDTYLTHPAHVAVLTVLKTLISDQAVVDYPVP